MMMNGLNTAKKMVLDESRIRREYESPGRRRQIALALWHQEWIRLHSEPRFEDNMSAPVLSLKSMIKRQLPQDKYNNAISLLRFPLPTNNIVDSIFDDLSEIFTGRNPVYSYQFRDIKHKEDWEWYRTNVLDEPHVWAATAWEYFRNEVNCIVVVDLPSPGSEDKEDPYPQPYFYFVPISEVISYGLDKKGGFEWVMFNNSYGSVNVIDGYSYRVFEKNDRNGLGALVGEFPHTLGMCPAKFLCDDAISVTVPDVKKSPITKALALLDWYVFSDINKRALDIGCAYPIYWGYEEQCDYTDNKGNICDHGIMSAPDGTHVLDAFGAEVVCPKCSRHKITGPGSFVRVPVPSPDQPDLHDPIGKIGVDRESLDYNADDLAKQRKLIIDYCVGRENDIINETSLADRQLEATFEKRTNVLENIKKGFEKIQAFVDSTICRLRYGRSFMQCSINYGTAFFTMTADSLRETYRNAKDAGASQSELQTIQEQILQTTYRNNPLLLERMRILLQIEPYTYLSRNDVLNLWEKGVCDEITLELKEDFNGYLSKFERENGNITEFGILLPLEERVKLIKETLYGYAKEEVDNRTVREPAGLSGPAGGGEPLPLPH